MQYNKAIENLRPHFSSRDHASVRVALVACIAFVSLELLRGNFRFAQKHLKAGLQILRESRIVDARHGVLRLRYTHGSDFIIAGVFSSLHLQVELFHQTFAHPVVIFELPNLRQFPEFRTGFHTFNEAWYALERLYHRILHLIEQFRIKNTVEGPEMTTRDSLMAEIAAWRSTYNFSKSRLDLMEPSSTAHHVLCEYAGTATIMCVTSGRRDENAFDEHTCRFLSILQHAVQLYRARSSPRPGWNGLGKQDFGMACSMTEMGWIPPLYYTAINCRVRRIRLHAIGLLEYTPHREGIWDSPALVRIARKVLELEGVSPMNLEPEFDLENMPTEDEVSIAVPLRKRLQEIQVIFEDTVSFRYKRADEWEHATV